MQVLPFVRQLEQVSVKFAIIDGQVFLGFSNLEVYLHVQDLQDLASTVALVKYVADAHGDEVEQWNGHLEVQRSYQE